MPILHDAWPSAILRPQAGETKFQLVRHLPAPDLAAYVQRYWVVSWDLRGCAPHRQETLPYPCVNLSFEPSGARAVGVVSGKFSVLLENKGWVLGVKFRPGAFFPFLQAPVSLLTDRSICIAELFGARGQALEQAVLAQASADAAIELVEAFLRERLPEPDPQVERINQIVDRIIADRSIIKVGQLASQFALSTRSLQRMFSQYVGVSPKWVIMRYRLHEAAGQLAERQTTRWPDLALELGYFDQAHFINDFKSVVGMPPAEYARTKERG